MVKQISVRLLWQWEYADKNTERISKKMQHQSCGVKDLLICLRNSIVFANYWVTRIEKKTLKVKGEKNRPEGEDDEEIMIIKIRGRMCMLNWTHIFEYSLHLPTFLHTFNSSLCSFLPSFICLFLPSIHWKCFWFDQKRIRNLFLKAAPPSLHNNKEKKMYLDK